MKVIIYKTDDYLLLLTIYSIKEGQFFTKASYTYFRVKTMYISVFN